MDGTSREVRGEVAEGISSSTRCWPRLKNLSLVFGNEDGNLAKSEKKVRRLLVASVDKVI